MTRIADENDTEALVRLINAAFVVERFFIDGDRVDAADVRRLIHTGAFLLADQLAACVYVELRGDSGYFGLLSVDPARQGTGLGRKMVEEAERYCSERGCEWMELRVVDVREELPPFYRKLGYVEDGMEPFPDTFKTKIPVRFVKMKKRLSTSERGSR